MTLFEVFAREKRELTKSEIARLLDLPESSTSDLLNTLYELGFVSRMASSRRFYPTNRLMKLATAIAENDPVTSFGREATSMLARETGETAVCAVLESDRIRIVSVSEGRHRLRYMVNVGDTFTLYATAVGKSLLANLPDEQMARLIRLHPLTALTSNTKVHPPALEADIRKSRREGLFRSVEEGMLGVSSFAIGCVLGTEPIGIGIIGPADRIAQNADTVTSILIRVRDSMFGDTALPQSG
jgi:DNA-binding IclR family transcriptional regulator